MNPDNPYAAPQTSLSQLPELTGFPLAEARGRNLFPETSTHELNRLANWDLAIGFMDMIWGVFLCFAMLAFCIQLGNNPFHWIWGGAVLLIGLRLWGGYTRTKLAWGYNLLLDAMFCAALLWAIVRLAQFDTLALLLVGGVALVFLSLSTASVLAHFAARPLYGQFPHRQLNIEVRYRQRNQIH